MGSLPNPVEVVGGGIDQGGLVGEDARLEVARRRALHSHPGAGQVGRADVGQRAVENQNLEMHTRTEAALQRIGLTLSVERRCRAAPQTLETVEILAEILARLLGVQQAHLDAAAQQAVDDRKERPGAVGPRAQAAAAPPRPSTKGDIKVLQVGRANPQVVLHASAKRQHLVVMLLVGNIAYHFSNRFPPP